jgi:ubiquinone/menaquinone biosynthesis C-methylase UbiE
MSTLELEIPGTTVEEMTSPQLRHTKSVEYFQSLVDRGIYPNNLLDIGCGNGTITTRLKKVLGLGIVEGVDLLAGKLDVPYWLRMQYADFDKDKLPYPDSVFKAIYCGEVIEHLYNPDNLLDEIHRVLKPGGICLITTPNLGSWYNRIVVLMGYQPCSISASFYHENVGKIINIVGHRGHIRGFTLRALKELLKIHDLEPIKVMGWNMGVSETYLSNPIIQYPAFAVDTVLSKVPSLAARLAIAVSKE